MLKVWITYSDLWERRYSTGVQRGYAYEYTARGTTWRPLPTFRTKLMIPTSTLSPEYGTPRAHLNLSEVTRYARVNSTVMKSGWSCTIFRWSEPFYPRVAGKITMPDAFLSQNRLLTSMNSRLPHATLSLPLARYVVSSMSEFCCYLLEFRASRCDIFDVH